MQGIFSRQNPDETANGGDPDETVDGDQDDEAEASQLVGYIISAPDEIDHKIQSLLIQRWSPERIADDLNEAAVCVPAQRVRWSESSVTERIRRRDLHTEQTRRFEHLRRLKHHLNAPALLTEAVQRSDRETVLECIQQEAKSGFTEQRLDDLLYIHQLDVSVAPWR